MLCFLSIHDGNGNGGPWWLIPTNMENKPTRLFRCVVSKHPREWLTGNPEDFLKRGDSVIRTPEVENFASLQFFQAMNFQWSFWKASLPWFFLADFFRGKLGANSQLWGQVVSPLLTYIYIYCACITHCSATCSTYKNIQVNIWLPGSWHWSCKKNIDIFRYSSKKAWVLSGGSSISSPAWQLSVTTWLAVRLRMGMAFSPKKNYNLWLGCWIFGVSISMIFLWFSGWF